MSDRKSAAIKKKGNARRVPKENRAPGVKVSPPIIVHQRSQSEFSCGVDFERATLVEESLDERERRG